MSRVSYDEYKKVKDFAPTGCLLLDLAVGGGIGLGFPFGVMVNLVGDKSAGKTLLAKEMNAASYYKYPKQLKWNYDDCELGDTFDTKKLYGVDLKKHENHSNYQSDLVETMDGNTSRFIKDIRSKNQRGIYFVDSLDGLSDKDKEKQEKEFEKMAVTGKAKEGNGSFNTGTASHLSKQYFRTKVRKLADKKVLLVIISQVRENLNAGLFGKKLYRAGGKAMDFYAHSCVWLYTVKKLKKGGRKVGDKMMGAKTVGVVVKAVTEKSKTPRPFRECYFTIYFDYGIDNIGSCLDFLFDLRGESGELLKTANNVMWGADGVPRTWKNIQPWIKEIGVYEQLKVLKKDDVGKASLSMEWLETFIDTPPHKDDPEEIVKLKNKLKKKGDKYFGVGISRDTLIEQIENDPKMYEDLERRTIDKWEDEEVAVLSNRKRKYS